MDSNLQILNQEIILHIIRNNFISFLKKVKLSITKKLYIINIYFFIVQHEYKKYIRKLKGKSKVKRLKKLVKMFKCRKFFKITKNIITLVNNPNGGRVTSTHAYLFYFRNLKEKFIRGLKLNIKRNRFYINRTLLLFGIRNKISVMYLFREMKKYYNSTLFDQKTGIFYKIIFMKKAKRETKQNIQLEESFRLLRRYQYINNLKYIMKRFNPYYLGLLKNLPNFKLVKKKFLLKKGLRMLINYGTIKYKMNKKRQEQFSLIKQTFLRRVRHRITNKIILKKNINILIRKITKKYNYRTFRLLKKLHFLAKEGKSEIIRFFYLNFGLKLLKKHSKISNKMIKKDNIIKNKSKIINYIKIKQFIKNSKNFIHYNENKKKSLLFLKRKIEKKIFKGFKNNFDYQKLKKEKSLICQKIDQFYLKKFAIKKWKLYHLYKLNKRNEFKYLENKRNEIISRHLIEKLIIEYSKEQREKENYLSGEYLNKNSKGIRLAMLWFNKLKTRVLLKKKDKENKIIQSKILNNNIFNENSIINTSIPINKNIPKSIPKISNEKMTNSNVINSELQELKSLRNKKRAAPVRINLDNL